MIKSKHMKHSFAASSKFVWLFLGLIGCLAIFALSKTVFLQTASPSAQIPVAPPTPAPQDIRTAIDEGAAAREKGDYQTGETKLAWAFDAAIAAGDKATAIEAGNNVSIQYRLSAGRANRTSQTELAQSYSLKSLAVYQKLRDLGWFDDKDPNIARNWAHALLYAGKIEEAIPALQASLAIQTAPAAQGDESDHLAAAYLSQGKSAEAKQLFTKGISLIEKNKGSKIWLTFGLMTKATWEAQNKQEANATKTIQQALKIAEENNLAVRKEELMYLATVSAKDISVLEAVGTPIK